MTKPPVVQSRQPRWGTVGTELIEGAVPAQRRRQDEGRGRRDALGAAVAL